MEQKYNERLKLDVSEAAKAIIEEADNVIARVKVNSAQHLKEVVAKRVESERNGKLANLNALEERVKQIEKQELELSSAAETMIGFRKINSSLDAIRNILYSNTPSEKCGQELVKRINTLRNLTKPLKNDVINSALSSLPSDRTLLKTGGVLTQSQLISRWETLTPEIRKVSLAPPNSGVLGQISSFLFSKLLVQKSGVPEKSDDSIAGSDVESVLARVNDDLVKNNLDSAVEEVANMKGWPRRLANDWLEESRKKLELQFLVEVIDTEIRVIS
ncbi:putative mitochondrial protein fmp13 [Brettanomyces bruxellensis AWRI1499]|nr:putative mitochondrial protein fmp13 [Brettanomyces bruxellensis AWRI1499]